VSVDAQVLPTGVDRVDGELSSTVSGNGSGSVDVDIAIIDTGIVLSHPDLNVVGGVNCSTGRSFVDGLVAAARPAEAWAADAEAAVRSTNNAIARLNLEFGRLALDEASFEYSSMMSRIQTIRRLGVEAGEDAHVQAAGSNSTFAFSAGTVVPSRRTPHVSG
jgi:hypothetical protein